MKNKYLENLTAEELANYDLSWFKDKIVVVDDLEIYRKVITRLKEKKILGFDTETRPSFMARSC